MMAAIPRAKRERDKAPIIRRDHDYPGGNFISKESLNYKPRQFSLQAHGNRKNKDARSDFTNLY
jgi:hypothetical protein